MNAIITGCSRFVRAITELQVEPEPQQGIIKAYQDDVHQISSPIRPSTHPPLHPSAPSPLRPSAISPSAPPPIRCTV